jgi:hypothetical protein
MTDNSNRDILATNVGIVTKKNNQTNIKGILASNTNPDNKTTKVKHTDRIKQPKIACKYA